MSLSEMSPVAREHGLHELALRVGEMLEEQGETAGPTIVEDLAERTGAPRSDVVVALGRVSLDMTPRGTVIIDPNWRATA